MLRALDAKLADSLQDGDTFEFGIHYGRRVEFEYAFNTSRSVGSDVVSRSLVQSLSGRELKDASVATASGSSPENGVVRGVVKISKERYDAWLAEVIASANLRVAAMLHDPTKP